MNAIKAKKPVYQLRLKFSGSIDDVEEWLDNNCEGAYSYQLEGITETEAVFNQLDLLFAFDLDSDRKNFKEAVVHGTF